MGVLPWSCCVSIHSPSPSPAVSQKEQIHVRRRIWNWNRLCYLTHARRCPTYIDQVILQPLLQLFVHIDQACATGSIHVFPIARSLGHNLSTATGFRKVVRPLKLRQALQQRTRSILCERNWKSLRKEPLVRSRVLEIPCCRWTSRQLTPVGIPTSGLDPRTSRFKIVTCRLCDWRGCTSDTGFQKHTRVKHGDETNLYYCHSILIQLHDRRRSSCRLAQYSIQRKWLLSWKFSKSVFRLGVWEEKNITFKNVLDMQSVIPCQEPRTISV